MRKIAVTYFSHLNESQCVVKQGIVTYSKDRLVNSLWYKEDKLIANKTAQYSRHNFIENTSNAPDIHFVSIVTISQEAFWCSVPVLGIRDINALCLEINMINMINMIKM